jgi:hypothetical protein
MSRSYWHLIPVERVVLTKSLTKQLALLPGADLVDIINNPAEFKQSRNQLAFWKLFSVNT